MTQLHIFSYLHLSAQLNLLQAMAPSVILPKPPVLPYIGTLQGANKEGEKGLNNRLKGPQKHPIRHRKWCRSGQCFPYPHAELSRGVREGQIWHRRWSRALGIVRALTRLDHHKRNTPPGGSTAAGAHTRGRKHRRGRIQMQPCSFDKTTYGQGNPQKTKIRVTDSGPAKPNGQTRQGRKGW